MRSSKGLRGLVPTPIANLELFRDSSQRQEGQGSVIQQAVVRSPTVVGCQGSGYAVAVQRGLKNVGCEHHGVLC
jgi:hypothetical protein